VVIEGEKMEFKVVESDGDATEKGSCRVEGEFKEPETSLQGKHGDLEIEGEGKEL
jgi:hypothetical protein